MIQSNIEFDTFSLDCRDTKGRVTDISHGDSVYCLLLGRFKYSQKEELSNWPTHLLPAVVDFPPEDPLGQIAGAYSLVLVKVDGRSTYRKAGLLVHRGRSGWWEGAEIREIILI